MTIEAMSFISCLTFSQSRRKMSTDYFMNDESTGLEHALKNSVRQYLKQIGSKGGLAKSPAQQAARALTAAKMRAVRWKGRVKKAED